MYFGNQIVSKMRLFVVLWERGTLPQIDRIDRIDRTAHGEGFQSINNQVLSILEIQIDNNISLSLYGLGAVVNSVNFWRYTPPHERKIGKFSVNCSVNSLILGKTELTTNEESTTYRGRFLRLSPKSPKSFVINRTLQAQGLSVFCQFFSLEKKSNKRSPKMPINYKLYPSNWHEISRRLRFERAGNRCEWCGAENYKLHPVTGSKVVLTVAHLGIPKPDGTPGSKDDLHDVRESNLAALCQKCHLDFDRNDHQRRRVQNRIAARLERGEQLLPFES